MGSTSVNGKLRRHEDFHSTLGLTTLQPRSSEVAIEVACTLNITPAPNLRPNVQIYVRPRGRPERTTATVLGTGIFLSMIPPDLAFARTAYPHRTGRAL